MNIKQIKNKINKIVWYRQGGALVHFYCSNGYRAGYKRYDGFNFFFGKNNYGYFNKQREKKIAYDFIRRCLQGKNYLSKGYIKPWYKLVKQREKLIDIYWPLLRSLNNRQIELFYKQLQNLDYKVWFLGTIIESLDPWGDVIISDYLARHKKTISNDDLYILTSPYNLTFVQEYNLAILKLSHKADIITSDLIKKYYYINNSWAHVEKLTNKQVVDEVKLLKKKKPHLRKQQENELLNYSKDIRLKKKHLIKKYKLGPELVALFDLFSVIADWRDVRKGQTLKMNDFYFNYLKLLSSRTNIPIKYLYNLDALEADRINKIKSLKKDLIKRATGLFYYIENNKFKYFIGGKAIALHSKLQSALSKSKELKGVVASKGKVIGRAVVVIHKEDFTKVKKGDILITQMTRPEFAKVLNKVAGIITDEGGLICHAAIISRELGVPCVIGTQIATSVIKNGQKLSLDADQGIIRLL